ncbi:hypothetical protein EIP86_000385 [Pleurotus ostreatoroseus]|nr:hypothetical protein EIP86_000385 [Pleurotus ostreatoroseus]
MDSDSDTSSSSRAGTRDAKRTRKSSRGGHETSDSRHSTAGIFKILLREQSNIHELRSTLQDMAFRLQDETRRAASAEKTARDTVLRFKEANNLRLAAQLEATRLNEELRLYKVQLETARREIARGQELLDTMETQRHEAEESAARARTTARKYKEEKIVLAALQEGREQGIKEGIKRGRMLGYEDGRTAGYESGWSDAAKQFQKDVVDVSVNAKTPSVSLNQFPLPPEPEEHIRIYPPAEEPEPELGEFPTAPTAEPQIHIQPPSSTGSSRFIEHDILVDARKSPSVRSEHSILSPRSVPVEIFIPQLDADQRMHIPAPHILAPTPPTPDATPPLARLAVPVPTESPPLMVPPPSIERLAIDSASESDTSSVRGSARRPRPRRRTSDDSQSTTLSQFTLVGPPVASSARANAATSPSALSAIMEEKERSPSTASTVRRPMLSPSGPSPIPIAMPAPRSAEAQAQTVGLGTGRSPRLQMEYLNPNMVPSSGSPSRSPARSPSTSIASSVGFHQIVVEPPSRPESWRSSDVPQMGGLLSPRDADRPLPELSDTQPQAAEAPQVVQQPPLGFVAIGSGHDPHFTPLQSSSSHVAPPQPRTAVRSPSPESVSTIPIPVPAAAKRGRYTRRDTSDDSNSSASDSSFDSLTTPPERRRWLPSMIYASTPGPPASSATHSTAQDMSSSVRPERVPLPASSVDSSGTGTASAARVPLPPSSVGSPRSVYTRTTNRTGRGH